MNLVLKGSNQRHLMSRHEHSTASMTSGTILLPGPQVPPLLVLPHMHWSPFPSRCPCWECSNEGSPGSLASSHYLGQENRTGR